MFHLDNNSGISAMPAPAAMQSNATRWFTEGNGNNSPSWPGMDWFNIVQAEMLNILTAAGIAPDKAKVDQLATAIKAIIASNALQRKNNLSDVADVAKARQNLGLGSAAGHDEGDFLLTSGGAMTGPIGFSNAGKFNGYALNRQAPDSLMDVYNPPTITAKLWNKIGVIDATKSAYGRAVFTIFGCNSHDVGKPVQTGYATIDIIGTSTNSIPGMTLTFYKPDEANGTAILDAVLSSNSESSKKFDVWVLAQSAVAGLMSGGAQTVPGFFTLLDIPETSNAAPVAVTETGKVYLVSANKDGKVNIKGEMTVAGKTTFKEEVYLEDKRVMIDEPNPGAVENGQYVTTEAYCWRLLGRGGTADPAGATAKLFYREYVGTTNEVILHIVGFGIDTTFAFDGGSGDFKAQGNVRAHDVYAGNAYFTGDGNIWGTRWNPNGQWLWDAITELNNSTLNYVNTQFARNPGAAGFGGVGTYAFLSCNTAQSNGATVSGSELYSSGIGAQKSSSGWGDKSIVIQGTTMPGTWVCCGDQPAKSGNDVGATLYYRIA